MASSVCTVNNTLLPTTGPTGFNATAGATITIALESEVGVAGWSIYLSSADDVTFTNGNFTAVNNSKISLGALGPYQFVVPPLVGMRGAALQFTSIVNGDVANQTTFGVWVLNTDGSSLFFGGQSNERNATVGNAQQLNAMIMAIAQLGG